MGDKLAKKIKYMSCQSLWDTYMFGAEFVWSFCGAKIFLIFITLFVC